MIGAKVGPAGGAHAERSPGGDHVLWGEGWRRPQKEQLMPMLPVKKLLLGLLITSLEVA